MHFFQVPQPAPMPASVGKSLSQIQNVEEVEQLSVKELKTILTANFVDFKGCCEKKELLDRVAALWKSKQQTEGKSKFTVYFSNSFVMHNARVFLAYFNENLQHCRVFEC